MQICIFTGFQSRRWLCFIDNQAVLLSFWLASSTKLGRKVYFGYNFVQKMEKGTLLHSAPWRQKLQRVFSHQYGCQVTCQSAISDLNLVLSLAIASLQMPRMNLGLLLSYKEEKIKKRPSGNILHFLRNYLSFTNVHKLKINQFHFSLYFTKNNKKKHKKTKTKN